MKESKKHKYRIIAVLIAGIAIAAFLKSWKQTNLNGNLLKRSEAGEGSKEIELIARSGREEAESILTEMIDAFDYENCHFIMAATLSLNNLGSIFQECANNKLNGGGYARYWAANEKAYQTALEDLIRSSKS